MTLPMILSEPSRVFTFCKRFKMQLLLPLDYLILDLTTAADVESRSVCDSYVSSLHRNEHAVSC